MSNEKVKLTPEKYLEGGVTTDPYGMFVWANRPKGIQMVVDIQMRGWGDIQNQFESQQEAVKFQDELCQFIVDAINEKLENASLKERVRELEEGLEALVKLYVANRGSENQFISVVSAKKDCDEWLNALKLLANDQQG